MQRTRAQRRQPRKMAGKGFQRLQTAPGTRGSGTSEGLSQSRIGGCFLACSLTDKVLHMKKLTLIAALAAASVSNAWAVGGPLVFVGNTASFSTTVSGSFTDTWTFNIAAPGATAATSATNISFGGAGGIAGFAGSLALSPLSSSSTGSPPLVVNVLAGFTGVLAPGAYSLIISGNAGSGASYGGNVVLTPVPEPETYALMLAGLGVVGFVATRRRNRV
jgi:hypothetical protein